METQASRPIKPLVWAAGVALIVFCAAGTAALMGWIPTSQSRTAGLTPAGTEKVPFTQMGAAQPAGVPKRSNDEPRTEPVPAANAPRESGENAPRELVANAPRELAANAPRERLRCSTCGTIESTRAVSTRGESSGLGAVGGAVVGGLLGNQVGSGSGKQIATVLGAVGGVVAGNEIEKRVKASKRYEVTVNLEDGSRRVISQDEAPAWRAGDRVRIVDGAIRAN